MRTGRLSPASRLAWARLLLSRPEGASLYDLASEMGISVRTAHRYIVALELDGEPITDEQEGHRKVWRIRWTPGSVLVRDALQAFGVSSVEELLDQVSAALGVLAREQAKSKTEGVQA